MAVSGILDISVLNTAFENGLVSAPNGLFGANSGVYLSSINSSFGFGTNPHSFSLTYVPESFNHEELPTIGTSVEFAVDGFLVKGSITHADFSKDLKGNLLNVTVEDNRSTLNYFHLDTIGIHASTDTPCENLIDVPSWHTRTQISASGRSAGVKELEAIKSQGATYRQIYNAVEYYENTLGTLSGLLSAIPNPETVESQLPGSQDAYRWRFTAQPFLDALNTIMSDISYDMYWGMAEEKVYVVNRKNSVTIAQDNIPYEGDASETIHLKYGNDEADKPNKIKLFGGNMEGLVGSGRLIPASGAFNESYDLGITVGQPIFTAGWKNISINYYGPDGELAQDVPTDAELSAALKSIEYWAHEKDLENRISTSGFNPGSGATVGQVPNSDYLAQMTSRYNSEKSWVVNWYNKVKNLADTHYGKTYILSSDSDLYSHLDNIEVANEAWCNIENQASGSYEEGYTIDPSYNMLSPFYNSSTNKVRAYCVLPARTKWGVTGEGVPASFEAWNEDEINQFVPVKVDMWKSSRTRFTNSSFEWDSTEKGISVTFANFCFDPNAPRNENLLGASSGISTANNAFASGNWTGDFTDPLLNPVPFSELNPASGQSVAIPVRSSRRYGYEYPSVWSSGTGSKVDVEVNELYSPWRYEPKGSQSSVARLAADVASYLSSQKIDTQAATHAEVTKVGLPGISFDDFSSQQDGSQGYGAIQHGITSINVSKGLSEDWRTKYSVKSHFPQLVKAKPIQEDKRENFDFAIKRIEDTISSLQVDIQLPQAFTQIDDTRISNISVGSQAEKRSIPVTVTHVYDRDSGNPYYLAQDSRGRDYPRNLALNAGTLVSQKARAQDGLLDVGLDAVYHFEKLEDGTFQHWFTGGVDLTDAKIMTVVSEVKTVAVGATTYNVVDLNTIAPSGGQSVSITNVPLLDQDNTDAISNGSKIAISSPKKNNNIRSYDFTPDDSGNSDIFVQNTSGGGGSSTKFVQVVTSPDASTGEGGVVSTFAVGNIASTSYDDAADATKVSFVGIDPKIVSVGDIGIVTVESDTETQGEETVSISHVLCHIVKPTFINYGLV